MHTKTPTLHVGQHVQVKRGGQVVGGRVLQLGEGPLANKFCIEWDDEPGSEVWVAYTAVVG